MNDSQKPPYRVERSTDRRFKNITPHIEGPQEAVYGTFRLTDNQLEWICDALNAAWEQGRQAGLHEK
jgi:hypothetical protein